jgi:hypothetical protein
VAFQPLVQRFGVELLEMYGLAGLDGLVVSLVELRSFGMREEIPGASAHQVLAAHADHLGTGFAKMRVAPIAVQHQQTIGDAIEDGLKLLALLVKRILGSLFGDFG